MSLPMARARRKNVPSIQRSPYSSTSSHSRTESSKPSAVMSVACWSSPISQSSLISRISDATRARSASRVSSPATLRSTTLDRPRCTRVLPERASAASSSSMWRTGSPSEADISFSEGRRPAHSSPYCRSRKNSSVSREERGRA